MKIQHFTFYDKIRDDVHNDVHNTEVNYALFIVSLQWHDLFDKITAFIHYGNSIISLAPTSTVKVKVKVM